MRRRSNTQTVQWFLEMQAREQLDLDPAYQRRSVWNTDYRRYYIDTILRDYPSPTIYLELEAAPGEPTMYHVIDGKQRLETIIDFTNDRFHLGSLLEDQGYSDPYYSALSQDMKTSLVDYVLSVENISRSSYEEIQSAFARLNKNTAKLNRQELRKAQFSGAFITKMTELATNPFWTRIGVASRTRISRMLDVEYVSEIYLLTMHGVMEGGSNPLDDYYADYDSAIPEEDRTDARFYACLEWFSDLELAGRWNNLGDFYSLWAAVLELIEDGRIPTQRQAEEALTAFGEAVATPASDTERAYSDAVRQGTNKEASRSLRRAILASLLADAA